MRFHLIFFYFLFMAISGTLGQRVSLDSFDQQRIELNRKGMLVLGGWSAANLITSGVAYGNTQGESRYFQEMNLMWNGINLAIAGLGYWKAKRENPADRSAKAIWQRQQKVEKIFLFNAGLDLAYVASGLYLREKANATERPDRLKGYGHAIMLQGGFLLLFDAILYRLHQRHGAEFWKNHQVVFQTSPQGVGLVYRL